VIAYLETNSHKTHLVALKGPRGVRDIVVTPQSARRVVNRLRKYLTQPQMARRHQASVLRTL
jgi:hypothetical protein